jgi:hypothetical protein
MKTDRLTLASLGFLYVPVFLFLQFWIIPIIAIPLSVLIAFGIRQFVRQSASADELSNPFSRNEWLILASGALFWTWISGIGAFVPQYGDYDKHNLVFHDLITRPWPTEYVNARFDNPFLCYYLAYYLPTAVAAKLFNLSFQSAEWVSFTWGWLGVLLAFCWAARLSKKFRVWIAVGLPFLSGVEIAIRLFWSLYVDFKWNVPTWFAAVFSNRIPGYTRYETPRFAFSNHNWAQSIDPAPLVMQLQAVPQHTLGGWIAIGLIAYWQRRKSTPVALAFVVAAHLALVAVCQYRFGIVAAVHAAKCVYSFGLGTTGFHAFLSGIDWHHGQLLPGPFPDSVCRFYCRSVRNSFRRGFIRSFLGISTLARLHSLPLV